MTPLSGERGLVGKAIVFMLVLVVLAGIAAVDTASVLFTKTHVADLAEQAARDAATNFRHSRNRERADRVALDTISREDPEAKLAKFNVNFVSGEVTLTVRKTASTIAFKYFEALKDFTVAKATSTTGAPTI